MTVRGDRGIATVFALGLSVLVLTLALVLVQVALVVAGKHRTQAAADLAAIAGSAAALRGDDACERARSVATRNGASVEDCHTDLAVVTVRVVGRVRVAWRVHVRPRALARAAPSFYRPAT